MFFTNANTEIELLSNRIIQSNNINIRINGNVIKNISAATIPIRNMHTYAGI